MQLLHTGQNHWVCVCSVGCLPGTVRLFDSLYHDIISKEVEDQVRDLLAHSFQKLEYAPCQQQTNGSDCGVFAIAFATGLVFGSKSTKPEFWHCKNAPTFSGLSLSWSDVSISIVLNLLDLLTRILPFHRVQGCSIKIQFSYQDNYQLWPFTWSSQDNKSKLMIFIYRINCFNHTRIGHQQKN